jgi:acetylornithine deacetylase
MAAGLDTALRRRVRAALDREAALDFLKRAVGTPSVTGSEAAFARLLEAELSKLGASDVALEEFLPGRPNLRGVRHGTGEGRSLLVMGHLDTVHVRGWHDRWKGTDRADPFGAAVVEGALWGRGSADLKAGICAALMGLGTLDRAGLRLAGDVTLAFVGDEESGEPGSGVSAGMRRFCEQLDNGTLPHPRFAVYVEPTCLNVYAAQIGFFIADILVQGRSAYFGVPEQGVDALKAAHAILSALWDHDQTIRRAGDHPLVGGSFLLVTGIEGGGFIAVPEGCRVSLIRKLRPGENLDEARLAMEAAIHGAALHPDIRIEIRYPAGRDHPVGGIPFETLPDEPELRRLIGCIQAVAPGRGAIEGAPFWSEASFLTARGIPAVYFAPGDIRICHTFEERVQIREYREGILALALFLAGEGGRT